MPMGYLKKCLSTESRISGGRRKSSEDGVESTGRVSRGNADKNRGGVEHEPNGGKGRILKPNLAAKTKKFCVRGLEATGWKRKSVDLRLSQEKPSYTKEKATEKVAARDVKKKATEKFVGGYRKEKATEKVSGKLKSWRRKESNTSEDSLGTHEKLRLKRKKSGKGKEYATDISLDKDADCDVKEDSNLKKKHGWYQMRTLDKTGKKLRGHKKDLDDEAAAPPPKKKKRKIKIDPYDISNKRLDDSISIKDKAEVKEVELSKNALFRAILPSPSILSFVEDNLLGRRRLNELQHAGYNIKLSAPLDNIPFSTGTERERIEENVKVFRNKLEFFAAAKVMSSFPPPVIPEIAFAGRSNVGKSSLLNALTRQWGVVHVSDKPGYTQTINFFRLASKICLVDLPGYGFAYAKEEVKDAWEELVKEYVSTREGLERVCLLIDTKWGMKPRDHELIDLMERSQTPYQIVLTKTDAVFPIDVARRAMQVQESLKAKSSLVNPVMMVSSKSGAGIRSLRTVLAKIARFAKP